jgi:hypothetical protein
MTRWAALALLVAIGPARLARAADAGSDERGARMDEQSAATKKAGTAPARMARYRAYLASAGFAQPGEHAVEVRGLGLPQVGFYGYDDHGLRLKAAVTPRGVVRPGGRPEDDWRGLLAAAPDAMTAAERIAWLETDESPLAMRAPSPPATVLAPDRHPAAMVDPALWAFVAAPELTKDADGGLTLTAWFLMSGAQVPVRWTIAAGPRRTATIATIAASDLPEAQNGSLAAASVAARARRLLGAGNDDERCAGRSSASPRPAIERPRARWRRFWAMHTRRTPRGSWPPVRWRRWPSRWGSRRSRRRCAPTRRPG